MEPMIRGYSVKQQLSFLETQYPQEESERLLLRIPEEVRRGLQTIKPAEWYPRQYSIEVLRAIASHGGDSEKAAQDDLLRCGTFIATEATNTFLKLLMKILNPTLFFKKLPEFWSRDQKGGFIETDTSRADDNHIDVVIGDVAGFDHIGIVSTGWMYFALRSMGKENVQVKQSGWSLKTPGPERVTYEVTWA